MGQQLHRYENLLNRQFHADKPNRKWVTDISYIHTKQGILYLSMIRDLYDNSIVAYKTGTEQTVNLVLDTIRFAMRKEKKRAAAELHLHSDQGFQYTSQASIHKGRHVGQPAFSELFALLSLAGDSPPASKRTKIPRKSKAVRCEAVLREQKCPQTMKSPQRILCVFSRALRKYEGISAPPNRVCPCQSTQTPWERIALPRR